MACSNFSKICEDISSSRCTTGVVDIHDKWKNLQSEKFNYFFTPFGSRVTPSANLPLVSLTPMANLLPISTALAVPVAKFALSLIPVANLQPV
jgi:hypothetical protein